ncbi:DUF6308 family protein [Sinomonas flava]|uniref:HhH-GPD domain-containing protein n=1 Tax=Sinomonas flava TaxID=496857 RepID=A0ABP5NN59_9MICC
MTVNQVALAFHGIPEATALDHLEKYFGLGPHKGREFEGAHFELFSPSPADEITANDLVAVSLLSVHVPAKAALGLLDSKSHEISDLLVQIPGDLKLEDLRIERHEGYFGEGSPIRDLWRLMRSKHATWGIGPTTASKLLARKRPALVPIYDSVVARATGFSHDGGTWLAWHEALACAHSIVPALESLRSQSGLGHISLLRILDVVLWMEGRHGRRPVETVGESED